MTSSHYSCQSLDGVHITIIITLAIPGDRQTEGQTHRQTDRGRGRQTQRNSQTDRQTQLAVCQDVTSVSLLSWGHLLSQSRDLHLATYTMTIVFLIYQQVTYLKGCLHVKLKLACDKKKQGGATSVNSGECLTRHMA